MAKGQPFSVRLDEQTEKVIEAKGAPHATPEECDHRGLH